MGVSQAFLLLTRGNDGENIRCTALQQCAALSYTAGHDGTKTGDVMGTDEVMRKTLELAKAQLANYKTQAAEAQKRAQQQVANKSHSKAPHQSSQRKVQAA